MWRRPRRKETYHNFSFRLLFVVLPQCPCHHFFSLCASACPTFTMGKIYHFADKGNTRSPMWRLFIFPLQCVADWELDIQVTTGVSRFPPLRISLSATYCTAAQFYLGVAFILVIIAVCVCVRARDSRCEARKGNTADNIISSDKD